MNPTKVPLEAHKEKKLWFRAKTYGYGWYPVTWQGWGLVISYVVFVIYGAWNILNGSSGGLLAVKQFLISTSILTLFLLFFAYTHGEKLKWRWGKSNDQHDDTTDPT